MRRWTAPVSGLVVLLLVGSTVFVVPSEAARLAQDLHAVLLPAGGPRDQLDETADDTARRFAMGRPNELIRSTLRLTSADPMPQDWHPTRELHLAWTDLGTDEIQFDVYLGVAGTDASEAGLVTTVPGPEATVPVPSDGSFSVFVRPKADRPGRISIFGPFQVDATPPPTPQLTAPAEPPGYRFGINWTTSEDLSGILHYQLQRRLVGKQFENVTEDLSTSFMEDQIGNGQYEYRVRAVNGAGVPSAWSALAKVLVKAPMSNPGVGVQTYGVHANYTGILRLWDISDPGRYLRLSEVPTHLKGPYLRAEPAIETENQTLKTLVTTVVGTETNTLKIAEKLFIYLFDETDYDSAKAAGAESELQRAGETLDRKLGICGDLAVLYVTLLRIAGVPARPVHGYLDNALSGIGGFHMWVEVYVGPNDDAHPWMTVDVSGVTGTYQPEDLFPYFGIFNPDYLALGNEENYERFDDLQWNTWARFRYVTPRNAPKPQVDDRTTVVDYESEYGRLFFEPSSKRTLYRACQRPDESRPDDPCPNEAAPPGFSRYYGTKGISKKRIDYGAKLSTGLPSCLKVELRYPMTDPFGSVLPDQSAIYQVYDTSDSTQLRVGQPDDEGWVTFYDGTDVAGACDEL